MSMLSEVTHLQDIVDNLCTLSQDPSCLPESAEQIVSDAVHDIVQPSVLEHKVCGVVIESDYKPIALYGHFTYAFHFYCSL